MLPSEAKAVELAASQVLPEDDFGQGHLAAHAFGAAVAL
jgi:hypothetical protein